MPDRERFEDEERGGAPTAAESGGRVPEEMHHIQGSDREKPEPATEPTETRGRFSTGGRGKSTTARARGATTTGTRPGATSKTANRARARGAATRKRALARGATRKAAGAMQRKAEAKVLAGRTKTSPDRGRATSVRRKGGAQGSRPELARKARSAGRNRGLRARSAAGRSSAPSKRTPGRKAPGRKAGRNRSRTK